MPGSSGRLHLTSFYCDLVALTRGFSACSPSTGVSPNHVPRHSIARLPLNSLQVPPSHLETLSRAPPDTRLGSGIHHQGLLGLFVHLRHGLQKNKTRHSTPCVGGATRCDASSRSSSSAKRKATGSKSRESRPWEAQVGEPVKHAGMCT